MRSRKACFLQENKSHLQLCSGTKSLAGRAQWIFLVTCCMVSPQSTGSRLSENGVLSAWLSASGFSHACAPGSIQADSFSVGSQGGARSLCEAGKAWGPSRKRYDVRQGLAERRKPAWLPAFSWRKKRGLHFVRQGRPGKATPQAWEACVLLLHYRRPCQHSLDAANHTDRVPFLREVGARGVWRDHAARDQKKDRSAS